MEDLGLYIQTINNSAFATIFTSFSLTIDCFSFLLLDRHVMKILLYWNILCSLMRLRLVSTVQCKTDKALMKTARVLFLFPTAVVNMIKHQHIRLMVTC